MFKWRLDHHYYDTRSLIIVEHFLLVADISILIFLSTQLGRVCYQFIIAEDIFRFHSRRRRRPPSDSWFDIDSRHRRYVSILRNIIQVCWFCIVVVGVECERPKRFPWTLAWLTSREFRSERKQNWRSTPSNYSSERETRTVGTRYA